MMMMTSENKKAVVYVRLKDGVLDPQGVTIQKALNQMGYPDFVIGPVRTVFRTGVRCDRQGYRSQD